MFKKIANWKYLAVLCCLLLAPVWVAGQDLGSSNDLFRKKKTVKKRTSPKRVAPKKNRRSRAGRTRKRSSGKRKSRSNAGKTTVRKKKPATQTAEQNTAAEPDKKKVLIEKAAASAADAGRAEPIKSPAAAVAEKKTAGTKTPAESVPEVAEEPGRKKTVIGAGAEERPAGRSAAEFVDLFEKAIFDGNKARDSRNYTRAEQAYRRALSLNAEDFRAVYGLGNLYSDQGRWEEAEQAYRRAIEIAPDEPAPYIALGFVLTQPLGGKNLLARYAEAERLARRAIELAPRNPLAYDQLGVALELQGKISDETLQAYRRAIEMDPTAALPHAHLGRLLRKRGELRKSSKAYLDAIQLAVDVPTMILVADVMQSQQRYLESEQLLRRALREDPKHPTALFLLGRALTTRGSYDEAEEILKKSAAISPNSFVSYKLLGSLYARQGKLAEAEQSLRKALEVISPNEEKRLALEFEAIGDGYMRDNKKQQAARAYDQAVKLDGDRSELTEKLARAKTN